MKKIKFSVLMSVYIKEKPEYLKSAINSILNQTLKPSQIVIVCDGLLTKDLYSLLDNYKSTYENLFTIIKYSENKGLGQALNIGLAKCKYNYVARMDTDDIANINRFEKQLAFLEKNSSIDIVGSNIAEFEDNIENILSYRVVPKNHSDIIKYAHKRNPFNHMTVVFKKKSILSVGGYLDMPLSEDYYLWARLLNNGYIGANIQECLVYARTGNELIARRSSLAYARKMKNLRYSLYKIHFLSFYEFIVYTIIQTIVAISPKKLTRFIYVKLLHK